MRDLGFLLQIGGAAALLLWGLHMVQTGVQRAFGHRLRAALGPAMGTRARAFLAGAAATFVLQSSTATALMVAGFAGTGAVALAPALAAVAGANLGTALLVPLLSLDLGAMPLALVLAGVVAFRRRPTETLRNTGRVLIGLGLMLLALRLLGEVLQPLEQSEALRTVLGALSGSPLVFVALAAALASLSHSSLGTVLFTGSLAATGVVAPADALAMVLGANLGSALNPLLEAGSGPAGRRLPVGNLLNRAVGVLLGLAALPWLAGWLGTVPPAQAVALAHVAFNAATGVLFLPVLPLVARGLRRFLPDPPPAEDPAVPRFLDAAALEAPSVALAGAQREVLRLAGLVEDRMAGREGPGAAATGRLQQAIAAYLDRLPEDALGEAEARRAGDLRHFAQVLDLTMLALEADLLHPQARRARRAGRPPPPPPPATLREQMRLALAVMVTEDAVAARRLVEAKEELRGPPAGEAERELERGVRVVSGQLAAVAHPLLRRRGELLPTRLLPAEG